MEQYQIFKWFLLKKICMNVSQNMLGTYMYLLHIKFSKFSFTVN